MPGAEPCRVEAMPDAAVVPQDRMTDPARRSRSAADAAPYQLDDLDRLLVTWRRWQDLRAGGAPAWARSAAFENYVAARAALRAAHAPARAVPGADGPAARQDADRPRRRRYLAWLVAAAVVLLLLAVGAGLLGTDPIRRSPTGGPATAAELAGQRGETVTPRPAWLDAAPGI